MRTCSRGWALLALVLSAQALASMSGGFVKPDVLRVRASASADAPIVTRLPINHYVAVVGQPSADGWVEIWARNHEVLTGDKDAVRGFVRADMLSEKPQTEEMLEAGLAFAKTPEEEWMWMERLMALRGSDDDKERMLALAEKSGNTEWLAQARRMREPPPTVIGICFQGRVSILAQLVGNTLEPLVETLENTTKDSPEVKAAEARLRARALELTTLRFSQFRGGWADTGYLVQPKVVTELDISDTARSRIELGTCPVHRGETTAPNALVFVSAPLERGQSTPLPSAELAQYVARLPSPVYGLQVFAPPGRFVELNTGSVYLFQRGKPGIWACSDEACRGKRSIRSTRAPVWLRLASGQQLRIGSLTEDVDNVGWGSPANSGLWVHPEFAIQVFDDKGVVVEGLVTLNQYGC